MIILTLIGLTALSFRLGIQAAAKPPPKKAEKAEKADTTENLPADLNDLSLRVAALESLYDLDLSAAQLQELRAAAAGAAEARQRAAAKATPKLGDALRSLYKAMLNGEERDPIAELREHVEDLTDDTVELDDRVHPTDAARAKAAGALQKIKASQVAAYLSEHADEVADPVELMMDSLSEARDAGDEAEELDVDAQRSAEEVGWLVVGLDTAKAKQLSEQVGAWLKSGKQVKEEDFAARQPALEEAAKKIVGEVAPMAVLNHWMEHELATLLSNPQLAGAVDDLLSAKANANVAEH